MMTQLPSEAEEMLEAVAKGAVSLVPYVGGPLFDLWSICFSPLEKRKKAWSREVEAALKELREGFDLLPKALAHNEDFLTALLQSTQEAINTQDENKRVYLREYLISVGAKSIASIEIQESFFKMIRDFTGGHIEVLRYFKIEEDAISRAEDLDSIFYMYETARGKLDRMTFRFIIADLVSRMVLHLGDVRDMKEYASGQDPMFASGSKVHPAKITAFGEDFLLLIRKERQISQEEI